MASKTVTRSIERVVKGGGEGGPRSRFTENKIGISRFTEKKENILKNYVQSKALFVAFTIRPLRVLRDAKRKPISSFCISRMAASYSSEKSSESLSEESSSYSKS